MNIIFQFADITENNRYETDSAKVTFFASELTNGDGRWFVGSATKGATIRLQESSDASCNYMDDY